MIPSHDASARVATISLRQLRLFESIGRLKSVRRASQECALSQPAVTQALAKLEEQVGAALVDRRASGSYLNDLGEIFYVRVDRFFSQIEDALGELGVLGGAGAVKQVVNRLSRSQTRALTAIVETGSFGAAAKSLGLSEASLQRSVRDLQSNLRRPLFYRSAAGIVVTPAGQEFGRRLKLASLEIEWGIHELESARGGANSQIVVGAMPFGGSVLLASVLDEFLTAHPHADVRIVSENAAEMMRRLRAGDADFVVGLLQDSSAPDLASEAFHETPYSVVGRRGHPLTRTGRVSANDLLEYDWVIGNLGSSRRACFDNLFEGGPGPKTSIKTCSLPVVRKLLALSDRLTLMTSYELMHEDDGLSAVMCEPILPVPAIGVMRRADWRPTQLHTDFIEMVRRHVAGTADKRPLRAYSVEKGSLRPGSGADSLR